jgi:hypothetical protein
MKTPRSKNPAREYLLKNIKSVDQGSDKFVLRLPDGMRDIIAEMAERNGRSMNAEILFGLAHHIAYFSPDKAVPAGMTEIMNNAMVERIRRGEVQNTVREMGLKLEAIANELDQVVAASRAAVAGKKSPPA